MIPALIDTLIEIRDALLGDLPMSSIEILKQIPHSVSQGWDPIARSIIKPADWHVPDAEKILTPALMDPGYDGGKSTQLDAALLLETELNKLQNDYTDFRLAVVRFRETGAPILGGIRKNENAPGASTAKIAGLYALYQLLYEMTLLAVELSITKISTLQRAANAVWARKGFKNNAAGNRLPRLSRLFKFYTSDFATIYRGRVGIVVKDHFGLSGSGPKLFFNEYILEKLWPDSLPPPRDEAPGFSGGEKAGLLIRYVGYAYVASVMIQSGLFRPDPVAGIWVKWDYNGRDLPDTGAWPDTENPIRTLPSVQNITAKSVADFLTLLVQGRLVNQSASTEMLDILARGPCECNFHGSQLRSTNDLVVIANKCGIENAADIYNDAMVVQTDDAAATKSVIVALANNRPLADDLEREYMDIFNQIDHAIQTVS